MYPQDLIAAVSEKLKEIDTIEAPKEMMFWKTSWIREYPPVDYENFWYIRAASLLRKLYRKPIGINRLKKVYGGRSPGFVHYNHSASGSGAIIRRILQQLEKAGFVKKTEKSGRELTNAGRSILDKTAAEISRTESKITA
ncbi:40S ribosomal protein S19 [Candidatus Lokiarchaeum ossiferum]|uniref:40S ribosomal protein S19 n=1 Tax=Candidatus Lokiarchaeum ossiferum TaxID=2951803 RepID=UPI00352EAE04